jgi:hypothetical protein
MMIAIRSSASVRRMRYSMDMCVLPFLRAIGMIMTGHFVLPSTRRKAG